MEYNDLECLIEFKMNNLFTFKYFSIFCFSNLFLTKDLIILCAHAIKINLHFKYLIIEFYHSKPMK